MQGRNIIITGGSSGIGYATAMQLAKMGANIFLICRNKERAQKAVEEICAATRNRNIHFLLADLSAQRAIRQLNQDIRNRLERIDVLINNAGAVFPRFQKSEDGIEMTIATNHFAYFLLTHLLIDLIEKSDYARIVNVSSNAHHTATLDLASFTQERDYFIFKAYAQSKLANILFTAEFARRWNHSHISVNCLHPGLVKTDIGNKHTNWYSAFFWTLYSRIGGVSVEKGAKTSVYLATAPELNKVSGKYFAKCREAIPSALAQDITLQQQLWEVSEKLCPIR
jgi:NAD(P)-dependent dehydrogenase (short-subunit alcohol dehydrogenase family)